MEQEFSSTLLENAVTELSRLPGIGRKTALRLALYMLRRDENEAVSLGNALIAMRQGIKYCSVCHNISENDVCDICSNHSRDASTLCVVENVKDVVCVERTATFRGLYHVLGGLISPIDGIGPSDIEIASLIARAAMPEVKEIILALSPTMEGDTTGYYINRRLIGCGRKDLKVTRLARGVAVGNELEYTDELTLGRSIVDRRPYE